MVGLPGSKTPYIFYQAKMQMEKPASYFILNSFFFKGIDAENMIYIFTTCRTKVFYFGSVYCIIILLL